MRERDQRHVDARHESDLGREHPARIDDELCRDVALVRDDLVDAAVFDLDRGHAGVLAHLDAAPARAFDEGERELARVDVAVGG